MADVCFFKPEVVLFSRGLRHVDKACFAHTFRPAEDNWRHQIRNRKQHCAAAAAILKTDMTSLHHRKLS